MSILVEDEDIWPDVAPDESDSIWSGGVVQITLAAAAAQPTDANETAGGQAGHVKDAAGDPAVVRLAPSRPCQSSLNRRMKRSASSYDFPVGHLLDPAHRPSPVAFSYVRGDHPLWLASLPDFGYQDGHEANLSHSPSLSSYGQFAESMSAGSDGWRRRCGLTVSRGCFCAFLFCSLALHVLAAGYLYLLTLKGVDPIRMVASSRTWSVLTFAGIWLLGHVLLLFLCSSASMCRRWKQRTDAALAEAAAFARETMPEYGAIRTPSAIESQWRCFRASITPNKHRASHPSPAVKLSQVGVRRQSFHGTFDSLRFQANII